MSFLITPLETTTDSSKDVEMWVPNGNVGLHFNKSSNRNGQMNFIRKVKTYKSKISNYLTNEVIMSKITERKCTIKKEHLHHWLVNGVDKDFVAINESLWDAHPIKMATTTLNETNYVTIADSDNGPEIVEHKNTVAVQFHVDSKYEATIKIMNNYIDNKFEFIRENGKVDMNLEEAENYIRSMFYSKGPNAVKTNKTEEFTSKARGKAMFINK